MEHHCNHVKQSLEPTKAYEGLKTSGLEEAVSHIPHFRPEGL
jgi:hypothetical protein